MQSEKVAVLNRLTRSSPRHIHLWPFLSGVAYALDEYDGLAASAPKGKMTDEAYLQETLAVLAAVGTGVAPPTNWLRGFIYNAAITRLDAGWERSLRAILGDGSKTNGRTLYNKVRTSVAPQLPPYSSSSFKAVRDEVNGLKHYQEGAPEAIRENPTVLRGGFQRTA